MKNILFVVLFIGGIYSVSYGQNRSIKFEKGTWQEVLKKAEKQNKLVFLDCYTSWCGPCKKLVSEVFTNDAVADYYNAHFIPMQMDMEKGEGKELIEVFQIQAFPTLLYVDGKGCIQHKVVGYCTPEGLIAAGKQALDGDRNYNALIKRYDAGDREATFVRGYLEALAESYEQKKLWDATQEYLEGLDDSTFYTKETWKYINNGLANPLSSPFQKLINGREKFYPLVGQKVVDQKLASVLATAVSSVTGISPFGEVRPFREKEYQRLLTFLRDLPFDGASRYLAEMNIAQCIHGEDYAKMLEHINIVLDYNIFGERGPLSYVLLYVPYLSNAKEPETVKKAITLIDGLLPSMKHPLQESRMLNQKALLLENIGEVEQATSVRTAAKVAEEKGERMIIERMKSNEE